MSEADTVQYAFGQYVEVKVVEMQERGIYVQVPVSCYVDMGWAELTLKLSLTLPLRLE